MSSLRSLARFLGPKDSMPVFGVGCGSAETELEPVQRFLMRFLGMTDRVPLFGYSTCEMPLSGRALMRFVGIDPEDHLPLYALGCCLDAMSGSPGQLQFLLEWLRATGLDVPGLPSSPSLDFLLELLAAKPRDTSRPPSPSSPSLVYFLELLAASPRDISRPPSISGGPSLVYLLELLEATPEDVPGHSSITDASLRLLLELLTATPRDTSKLLSPSSPPLVYLLELLTATCRDVSYLPSILGDPPLVYVLEFPAPTSHDSSDLNYREAGNRGMFIAGGLPTSTSAVSSTAGKGAFVFTGHEKIFTWASSTTNGAFTLFGRDTTPHAALVVTAGSFAIQGQAAGSAIRTPAVRLVSDYTAGQTVRITATGTGDITVRWPDLSEETLTGGGEFTWTSTGTGDIFLYGMVTDFYARDWLAIHAPYSFSAIEFFADSIQLVSVAQTNITTLDLSACASEINLEAFSCLNLTTIDMGGNALKGTYAAVNANNMSDSDLNAFFTSLGTNISFTGDIEVQSNPGSTSCDVTIAESKGYTVFNDY